MAERAVPMAIQVRNAVLDVVRKIGVDDEAKWRTRPKTFAIAPDLSLVFEMALPAIFVSVGEKTSEPWTNEVHKDTLQVLIYCVNQDARDAESAMWDLISDVERAVRENLQLGTVLSSGYLHHRSSRGVPEMTAGKAGFGFGVVTAEAYYQTTDVDP